ncbi:MAG: hypothetical protein HQ581_01070 [Planctomycetes bacterium]|nr:hypothetical protein [Planctomycetota bacterium]
MGTVPVNEDGSAHFIVPANRELFFQAIGEDGLGPIRTAIWGVL